MVEETDNNLAKYMHEEMRGKDFCDLFPNLSKNLVKLTNETECHNGFQFKTGLNVDHKRFNPSGKCQPGGIYFTDIDNLPRWLEYNLIPMKYCRTVTLPPDCRVYIEENKFKADKIILGERVKIKDLSYWSDIVYCLNALKIDPDLPWKYIKNENMQIEAIRAGVSIVQILRNRIDMSEKVIKYSISDEIIEKYTSGDRSIEYARIIKLASQYGHIEVVKYLLSDEITAKIRGIDPSAFNVAIIMASLYGHIEVVKFLLSDEIMVKYPEIDPSVCNNKAIRMASNYGYLEVVKFLLSDRIREKCPEIDPSAENNEAIKLASQKGNIEVVKFLLSDEIMIKYPEIDPSACNNEAIRLASLYGHIEVVKYLLSDEIREKCPEIDPSADNNEAIRWAYYYGDMEIVKLLSQDQRVIKQGIPQHINVI